MGLLSKDTKPGASEKERPDSLADDKEKIRLNAPVTKETVSAISRDTPNREDRHE